MQGGLRVIDNIQKQDKPSKPLVSTITVVKNGESNLEETIQSVINQTYENIEYLIIDGASDDKTVDIIRKYEHKIDYWISEPDEGISDAFNKGIDFSSGTWINFLNSGDKYIYHSIVQEVSCFFDQEYIITGFAKYGITTIPERLISNKDRMNQRARISHQASFIHRDVFNKVGFFSKDYIIRMDYDFWLRALKQYEFKMLNHVLVDYDTHGISGKGSATKIFYDEQRKSNFTNKVEGRYVINLLLYLQYFKDRTKRFFSKK